MNRFLKIILLASLFLLFWTRILWAEWYKGLIHVHSTYSDGHWTLSKLKEEAMERGYHFLMITDHADSIPDDATFTRYVEECRNLSEENFVMIPGTEVTVDYCFSDRKQHILGIGLGHRKLDSGYYWWIQFGGTQREVLEQFAKEGIFTVAAHPYIGSRWFWDYESIRYLSAIEFFNHTATPSKEKETLNIYLRLIKDYLDYIGLEKIKFYPTLPVVTAGNDFHTPFVPGHFESRQTYVFARKLTEKDLLKSLHQGHSYASKGNCRIEEINYLPGLVPHQIDSPPQLKFKIKYFRMPKAFTAEAYIVKVFRNGEEVFSKFWDEVNRNIGLMDFEKIPPFAIEFQESDDLPEGLHIYTIYIEGELITSPIVFEYKKAEVEKEPKIVWERIYGTKKVDYSARSIQQTSDDGYIVVGNMIDFHKRKEGIFIMKLDENGHKKWSKEYNKINIGMISVQPSGGYSIQQTKDGGYVVTGIADYLNEWGHPEGSGDIFVMKLDEKGNKVWFKVFGGLSFDAAYSIQQTSDGGYIVAGATGSYGAGIILEEGYFSRMNAYLIKLDKKGNMIWEKVYGGEGNDYFKSVQETKDGKYLVSGLLYGKTRLLKFDKYGNEIWKRKYELDELHVSIQQTKDGGYIMAANISPFEEEKENICLLKLDKNGEVIWKRVYERKNDDNWHSSIQQTKDGGYLIVGGVKSSGRKESDIYISKVDENGEVLWEEAYGRKGDDLNGSIRPTKDGGYIMIGWIRDSEKWGFCGAVYDGDDERPEPCSAVHIIKFFLNSPR